MILLMIHLFIDYLVYFMKRGLELSSTLFMDQFKKYCVFFKPRHPVYQLSLKQLTIKTLDLIAITTLDRGQTLHLMNIKKMYISDTVFLITN